MKTIYSEKNNAIVMSTEQKKSALLLTFEVICGIISARKNAEN